MLRQGLIEFDLKQIQSIHREENKKRQQRQRQIQQFQQSRNNHTQIEGHQYSIVREEIFPSKFTPFFIDTFTKQSDLQIYQYSIKSNDIQKINARIQKFYQIINSFQQPQRQQLSCIFQTDLLKNFTDQASQKIKQKYSQNYFFSYFQEGKSLSEVQSWRFKHREDNPHIPYQSRNSLFQQSLLLFKFIYALTQTKQFQLISLDLKNIMVLQNQIINQNGKKYQLKIKFKWIFNTIVEKKTNIPSQNLLVTAKNLIIKLLSIQKQKQKQQKLQQFNINKIQELKSIDEIIKLKYEDFYLNVKKTQKTYQKSDLNITDKKQLLQKLKQQIYKLQEKAKQEIKEIKITKQDPKINFDSQESKKYFWNQINKIIIKNLTQNERKNIILASKKLTQLSKKPQNTKDNKSTIKQTKEKPINKSVTDNKSQQVMVQANYLSSGSSLKFRPDKLISLIEQKNILYVLKIFNISSNTTNNIGCYINAKIDKQSIGLFGSYFEDPSKRSFIYSEKNDFYYPLTDKNHAIGYGPEIFLSIGKLDIIIPCFGTQIINKKQMLKCVSYFPISYSSQGKSVLSFDQLQENQLDIKKEQQSKTNTSFDLIGLQRQFFLQEIDIYEISFKVT